MSVVTEAGVTIGVLTIKYDEDVTISELLTVDDEGQPIVWETYEQPEVE